MRVRLSYSVEVEEIIEEVQRLMNKSENRLHDAFSRFNRFRQDFSEEDLETMIQETDTARKELMRYDQTLEDCQTILQGYLGFLQQDEQREQNEQEETKDG
jgi:hypothetical protein